MIKPILFNTEMVRAIQDDRKTATRRLVKPQPKTKYVNPGTSPYYGSVLGDGWSFYIPPYQVGDILYVRETFGIHPNGKYCYRADYIGAYGWRGWRPSIHMPKEAARLFLRVTGVRAERLQDMTLDDFCSEGVGIRPEAFNDPENAYWQGREAYIDTWNSIYARPQPVKENGKIVRYESYPWEDIRETRTYQGLPWLVIGNPWIWVIEFERISKEEALKNE